MMTPYSMAVSSDHTGNDSTPDRSDADAIA